MTDSNLRPFRSGEVPSKPAAANVRRRFVIAGGGFVTGTVSMSLMMSSNHFVATLAGGALYGYVTYRLLGFPPEPGKALIVASAGGIGFLVAYLMALQGGWFLLMLMLPEVREWQWVATFPIGGVAGSAIYLAGLRGAGVALTFRTVTVFLLVNIAASYACLFLNYFGIPVWQTLTAFVLGSVRPAEEIAKTVRDPEPETPVAHEGVSPLP